MSVYDQIFLAASLVGTAALSIAQDKPLTVCQVLNSDLDHQEVKVSGILVGAASHGYSLSEGINANPCPGWPRRIFTAPSNLGLEFSSALGVRLDPEEVRSNLTFLDRLAAVYRWNPVNIRVSATGVAVKTPWSITFRRGDGTYVSTNSEPYGCFRVVLVIRSISSQ